MAQRILGRRRGAARSSRGGARPRADGYLPTPTAAFIDAAGARARGLGRRGHGARDARADRRAAASSVEELMRIADETAQTHRILRPARAKIRGARAHRRAQLRDGNDELPALDRQKDEFLGQISHELRTPMTSIRSFSEILREGGAGRRGRARGGFLAIIHDEALRLTRLLDDLLDLSRPRGASPTGRYRPSPGAAISAALEASPASRADVTIRRDPVPPDPIVMADADRLRQVLVNLLSNA